MADITKTMPMFYAVYGFEVVNTCWRTMLLLASQLMNLSSALLKAEEEHDRIFLQEYKEICWVFWHILLNRCII